MTEFPDDELDKLFRKSSEELDPTFEPNDWSELKKRLDAEDGISSGGWWRKWWPAGLVLLFLGGATGSYFLFSDAGGKQNVSNKVSVSQSVSSGSETGAGLNKKEKTEQVAAQEDSVAYGEIEVARGNLSAHPDASTARDKTLPRRLSKAGGVHLEPNRSVGKEGDGAFSATSQGIDARLTDVASTDNAESSVREKARRKSREKLADTRSRDRSSGTVNGRVVVEADTDARANAGKQIGNGIAPDADEKLQVSGETAMQSAEERTLGDLTVDLANPVAFRNKSPEQQTEVVVPDPRASELQPEVSVPTPFLAVRFGYSPDLSTVGLKNFSKPGSAFSIMGELAVVPRLYLQAGVVRSVKEYSAGGSEYTFSRYVTDIATPDNVDGTCKMFEVPVGFRFDVLRMERSSLFAGTGMSSYYVQNEKYKYNYSKYTHGAKQGWEGSTGWFWLSHINASVGYEYKVAPRLSLLAEPYLRIPVKRVGYGKVNLTTTGVWISIRYVPVFR